MGSVYRKAVTKPLPGDAEIITRKGEKLARWRDTKGKTRTAPLQHLARRFPNTQHGRGWVRWNSPGGCLHA